MYVHMYIRAYVYLADIHTRAGRYQNFDDGTVLSRYYCTHFNPLKCPQIHLKLLLELYHK